MIAPMWFVGWTKRNCERQDGQDGQDGQDDEDDQRGSAVIFVILSILSIPLLLFPISTDRDADGRDDVRREDWPAIPNRRCHAV